MNIEQTINNLLADTLVPLIELPLSELPVKSTIHVEGTQASVHLSSAFPCAALKNTLLLELTAKIQSALPGLKIEVTLDQFIKSHQTQLPGYSLRGVKNTIAIASGKGGVGKSTVAVNLAVALARAGARVGLLDADIYGPSVPLMLGKAAPVAVDNDRYQPVQTHGIQAMSIGYLTQSDSALIWRGPMLAKSLLQMLDLTQWDELDYLLIDLPPGTGDIQLSLVQKIPLTGAVIVTTPQTVATLDAQKALQMFKKTNIDILGLIENMSLHVCSQCNHQEAIFGNGGAEALCKHWDCPLLGQLPLERQIRVQCDTGTPIASMGNDPIAEHFTRIALKTSVQLAKKPLNYAGKFPPIAVES